MDFDKTYFEKYGAFHRGDYEVFERHKGMFPSNSVLWVGSFQGKIVKHLREDLGVDCRGFDINKYVIENANFIPEYNTWNDIVNPVGYIRPADIVVCKDVLEHLCFEDAIKSIKNLIGLTNHLLIIGITVSEHDSYFTDVTHKTFFSFNTWGEIIEYYGTRILRKSKKYGEYVCLRIK